MYQHMSDWGAWDWFVMVPMMLLWIAVLGIVIYGSVRLAIEHTQKPPVPPAER